MIRIRISILLIITLVFLPVVTAFAQYCPESDVNTRLTQSQYVDKTHAQMATDSVDHNKPTTCLVTNCIAAHNLAIYWPTSLAKTESNYHAVLFISTNLTPPAGVFLPPEIKPPIQS